MKAIKNTISSNNNNNNQTIANNKTTKSPIREDNGDTSVINRIDNKCNKYTETCKNDTDNKSIINSSLNYHKNNNINFFFNNKTDNNISVNYSSTYKNLYTEDFNNYNTNNTNNTINKNITNNRNNTNTYNTNNNNYTSNKNNKRTSWIHRFLRTFSKVWLLLHTSSTLLSTLVQSVSPHESIKGVSTTSSISYHNYTLYSHYYHAMKEPHLINASIIPTNASFNDISNKNSFKKIHFLSSSDDERNVYKISEDTKKHQNQHQNLPSCFPYNFYPRRLNLKNEQNNGNILKGDKKRLHASSYESRKGGKDLKNRHRNFNINGKNKNNLFNNSLEKIYKRKLIRRQAENVMASSMFSTSSSSSSLSTSEISSVSSLSSPSLTTSSSSSQTAIKNHARRRRYYISRTNIDNNYKLKNINNNNKLKNINKNHRYNSNKNNNHPNHNNKKFTTEYQDDEEALHENHHLEPQKLSSSSFSSSSDFSNDQYACVYSGHVFTNKDWYGFLANLSMAGGVGRMEFEFSFPSEMCCYNVLFYNEDQLTMMNTSMNCWQKENLLDKGSNRFLSLTPNFSWSGCHLKQQRGTNKRIFYCRGGRSFMENHSRQDFYQGHFHVKKLTNAVNWFVAISNCDAMRGIDIHFRFRVYGHSMPCGEDATNDVFFNNLHPLVDVEKTPVVVPSSSAGVAPAVPDNLHGKWPVCTIEGYVNTTNSWYGFLKNISLQDGGGFKYHFSLPYSMTPMSVYLYHKEDIHKLRWEQICWIKHGAIESSHVEERIINLSTSSVFNGCATKKGANIEGNNLTCKGEKIFRGDRDIYVAVGNCRGGNGVMLKYRLDVFGYKKNTLCSSASEIFRSSIFEIITFVVVYGSVFWYHQ